MDFSQYQRLAMRTKGNYRDDQDQLHAALTGLVGELGEVAEIIKKHLWHGRDLDVDELRAEIGDTMWYQALMCDALGLDMQAVAEGNIAKLRERWPDGFKVEGRREEVSLEEPARELLWRVAFTVPEHFIARAEQLAILVATSDRDGLGMMWGNVLAQDPHRARQKITSELMRLGVDLSTVDIVSITKIRP